MAFIAAAVIEPQNSISPSACVSLPGAGSKHRASDSQRVSTAHGGSWQDANEIHKDIVIKTDAYEIFFERDMTALARSGSDPE